MRHWLATALFVLAAPLTGCNVSASGEASVTGDADAAAAPAAAVAPAPAAPAPAPAAADEAPAAPQAASAAWQRITIVSYQCGDNCYLEYSTGGPNTETAMCNTRLCDSWFEVQQMPDSEIGKRYEVRLGTTQQFDNEYRVMEEDFPAIIEMRPAR